MEIRSVQKFIDYYEKTREVTNRVVDVIPADKIEWAYAPGKFTLGDLVRHIAGIERQIFMPTILGEKPCYKGCGKELAEGYTNVVAYFREMHRQSMEILQALSDADLERTVKTLDGRTITAGNFLRALIVHEVHHRGAMVIYLNLLHVATPPMLGLTEKQVIEACNRE